mgnify:CR=1 FL=1
MTATTPKTKRDRAAGRHHRHTAIQTIKDNHQGIIDDIASIDNSIASLQDETCNLGSRLDHWYDRLNQADENNRVSVSYTLRRVVENERKQSEVESAVGILQESSKEHQGGIAFLNHTSKEHQEAIAQLIAYVNKVHGKQTAFNQEITLLQAELDDTQAELKALSKLTILLGVAMLLACITLFFITTTH